MDIEKEILQKLKTIAKKPVTKNQTIKELGVDSLDLVEMVVEYEEKYKVSILDDELNKMKSVDDIIKTFLKHTK